MAIAHHHPGPAVDDAADGAVTVFGSLGPPDWQGFTDLELRTRLDELGLRPGDVAMMVAKRGTTLGAILIDKVLRPVG